MERQELKIYKKYMCGCRKGEPRDCSHNICLRRAIHEAYKAGKSKNTIIQPLYLTTKDFKPLPKRKWEIYLEKKIRTDERIRVAPLIRVLNAFLTDWNSTQNSAPIQEFYGHIGKIERELKRLGT